MKVFRVIYFAKGFQRVSIVVAKNEEQAEKMVSKDFDRKDHYEFNRIQECELTTENIIHTEVIEIV
ncbi:hypothetical protein HFZ78_23680 [Priestia megaterium]|uniref:Uncharacterized protein n=1 Tax=Priestia megaterium TaxID=1404 RepID=A0A6H1P6X6_PRIMG|nr:hypothetical protein [Priestia megaterium]QIZ09329.1 hypothetical protein HFZ78_23680 [Priestia megaterium]